MPSADEAEAFGLGEGQPVLLVDSRRLARLWLSRSVSDPIGLTVAKPFQNADSARCVIGGDGRSPGAEYLSWRGLSAHRGRADPLVTVTGVERDHGESGRQDRDPDPAEDDARAVLWRQSPDNHQGIPQVWFSL
jgi:hypothetical protein